MNKKAYISIFVILVIVSVITACTGSAPEKSEVGTLEPTQVTATLTATSTLTPTATATITPTTTPTLTPTPLDVGPDNFPEEINPLTGLVVDDPARLNRRPIATKIQLFPRYGRPPIGISAADIVWEYYHNGGATRLHSVFYGQDATEIGPIRSARLPDHDLIQMYKSIFAYGSADWRVNQRLFTASYSPYLVLEGELAECPPTVENPMCRFEPDGQNLLLTGSAELTEYITTEEGLLNERQNLSGMRFTSEPPQGGETGTQVTVRYSLDAYTRWVFDPETGLYVRYQDAQLDNGNGEEYEVLTDRNTEKPITASNVIVILADHSYFFRSGSSEIVEINLLGSGDAYLLRDGKVYQVTWSRTNGDEILSLVDVNGNPFSLKPGNSWYQVVGTSSLITQPENGAYRFEFRIP